MHVYIVSCTQRIINSIKRFLIKEITLRVGGKAQVVEYYLSVQEAINLYLNIKCRV